MPTLTVKLYVQFALMNLLTFISCRYFGLPLVFWNPNMSLNIYWLFAFYAKF